MTDALLKEDLAFRAADHVFLQIKQEEPGPKAKAKGSLMWEAPWGDFIELARLRQVRIDKAGRPHVMINVAGNLFVYLFCESEVDILVMFDAALTREPMDMIDQPRTHLDVIHPRKKAVIGCWRRQPKHQWQKMDPASLTG